MSIGAFELPPPDGEKEKVYLDELESVRRTLAVMAKISSESDLPEAAGEIEGLADQMLEIAVVRSHLKGSFDFVNRDYVKCDKAFNLVERALRRGIETDIGTGTAFEKSLENFKLTRDLVDEAAGGVEEAELRQQLALARGLVTEQPEIQVAAAEPERQEKPTSPPPPTPAASNSTAKPKPTESQPQNSTASASGERPGFGRRSGFGRPSGFGGPGGRPSEMQGQSGSAASRSGAGSRSDGRSSFDERRARFNGHDSAKLLFKTTADAKTFCDALMKKMSIRDYLFHSSNGQTTLYMKFGGTLDELSDAVSDATVIKKNDDTRELHVELK